MAAVRMPPSTSDARCMMAASIVSSALEVPVSAIFAPDRSNGSVSLARHVAIYLAHVGFQAPMPATARGFGRDRSSVAYACARIEDMRDDQKFDEAVCAMERMVERLREQEAPAAVGLVEALASAMSSKAS